MLIRRHLAEIVNKTKKSILLLGPRQTGKSTLIRSLSPDLEIDLSDEQAYLDHLKDPALIKKRVSGHRRVFVDEIQRVPSMLNTIQSLIDHDRSLQFFLTGSSARKLKRGKANLLPGRILTYRLDPLAMSELAEFADMDRLLSVGALPGVYLEQDPAIARKTLRSYAATYLREEIQAEALTRNLEGFSRYFELLAARSGDFVDFNKLASTARIDRMSAKRYFDILVDTLIARPVEAFAKSAKRRLIQHPKLYFFDVGVLNGCLGNFEASADRRGSLFEHLCLQAIAAELGARDRDFRISAYRTEGGAEVDFIVEIGSDVFAVEAKATRNIGNQDLRGLKSFADYFGKRHHALILYLGEHPLRIDGVSVMPLGSGLQFFG